VTWREGTRGAMRSRFARLRIRPAHRDEKRSALRPEEELLIEWPRGEPEPTKYWLSTLLPPTPLADLAADAQPAKVPRVGYVFGLPSSESRHLLEAFRRGLRELGYVEGQNVALEGRWAEGRSDRLPGLVAELVRLPVDVLVVESGLAGLAAKKATQTIPIVMAPVGDPVGSGLVASLGRPGGNITGVSLFAPDLSWKRLELLQEAVPEVSRVGVLWNPANPNSAAQLRQTEVAARRWV
jgi:putative tryptophan/tyrosine transport system substrate-binding protein